VIRNYDREGKEYDKIRYGRTKGGRFFSEVELSETLRQMKPGRVLNVGTATGRVPNHLVSMKFDYVGLEISKVMAKITLERLDGGGSIICADAENLPFKEDMFDNVVSVRSFHFFPNPEKFLVDAKRVLKPNGRLIVSFEKRVRGRETFRRMMSLAESAVRRSYYTNSEVALMMRNAGFKTIHTGNVTKLPLLVYWRVKNDRILRKLHGKIPLTLGTVGMAVGTKVGT